MDSGEFSPVGYFNLIMKRWWIVFLATLVGGSLGFVIHTFLPPVYEATATFFVTLDLDHFPFQGLRMDLIQYNEDMVLGTTEGALRSADVRDNLIAILKTSGIALTPYDITKNSTIERKHDIWELRYRSPDPQLAQAIVNTWAKIGYQAMLTWQSTGKTPSYVIFQPPTEAQLPLHPVIYGRNNLVLAGAVIGFIIGILISSPKRYPSRSASMTT